MDVRRVVAPLTVRSLTRTFLRPLVLVAVLASGVFVLVPPDRSEGVEFVAPVVRAFGDGVTAGFGVLGDGRPVSIAEMPGCLPVPPVLDDRCSSNSPLGPGAERSPLRFTGDFGLDNGWSWAARVATSLGATDFANRAVTHSQPRHWMNLAPKPGREDDGALHAQLERIVSDDPDLVMVTLGGASVLLDSWSGPIVACASRAEPPAFTECVNAVLDGALLQQSLTAVFLGVMARTTDARLLVGTYLDIPPIVGLLDPMQHTLLTEALNGRIRAAVAAVSDAGATWAGRIAVVEPATGADPCRWSPWARARLAPTATGCVAGSAWVLDSDLGRHPSAAGQQAYAEAALATIDSLGWPEFWTRR